MASVKHSPVANRRQLQVFAALAGGVVLATALLHWADGQLFARFLGRVNPILAMLGAGIGGMVMLFLLIRQEHFFILKKQSRPGMGPLLGLAAAMAAIMIVVDLRVVFPADINILFPESILFYPAIAFFVEILFHVLPLGLLLIFAPAFKGRMGKQAIPWLLLVLVALPEPVYQVLAMAGQGAYPSGVLVYVGVHLFAFNLLQLYTFHQRDFFSMYWLRLAYYLVWHIAWGQIRLGVLF